MFRISDALSLRISFSKESRIKLSPEDTTMAKRKPYIWLQENEEV